MKNEIIDKLNSIQMYVMLQAKKALNLEEACAFTGMSKKTLYNLTSQHKIPYYKPTGKLLFFDKDELQEWMLQGRMVTEEEALKQFGY
jgi:excisionase family DNA binding protein